MLSQQQHPGAPSTGIPCRPSTYDARPHLHDQLPRQSSPAPQLLQDPGHHVGTLGILPRSHVQLCHSLGIEVGRGDCGWEEGQRQGPCAVALDRVDGFVGGDGAQAGAEEGVGLVLQTRTDWFRVTCVLEEACIADDGLQEASS